MQLIKRDDEKSTGKHPCTESSGSWKGAKNFSLKQASEQHAGTFSGDGVTGAPVIELEYKHYLQCRTWRG